MQHGISLWRGGGGLYDQLGLLGGGGGGAPLVLGGEVDYLLTVGERLLGGEGRGQRFAAVVVFVETKDGTVREKRP